MMSSLASTNVPRALSGPDKAALLILGLDEDVATKVLGHLSEEQLKQLAGSAVRLAPNAVEGLDSTYEEFERLMRVPGPVGPASAATYFRNLAAKAIGAEKAQRLLAPAGPPTPIEALRSAKVATLAEILQGEHPQLAAVILAQLPVKRASQLLSSMSADRKKDVLGRLSDLTEIPADVATLASEVLARSLVAAGALSGAEEQEFEGAKFVAGVLNELEQEESQRLLEDLMQRSEKSAQKVREAMFTFEELLKLESRSIQAIMKEVSSDQLLVALKAASEELQKLFFSAVSTRAAAALREELALLPPMRLSEVEIAQRSIVEVALRLAAEGSITLPGRGSERLV